MGYSPRVAEWDTTGWLSNKGPLSLLLHCLWPTPLAPLPNEFLTRCRFMVTLTDAKQMPQQFLRTVQGRVSSVLPQAGWEAGPPPADRGRGLQLGRSLCGAGARLTPPTPQAPVFLGPQILSLHSYFWGDGGHRGWTPSAFAGLEGSRDRKQAVITLLLCSDPAAAVSISAILNKCV